jgi:hypothetical protein
MKTLLNLIVVLSMASPAWSQTSLNPDYPLFKQKMQQQLAKVSQQMQAIEHQLPTQPANKQKDQLEALKQLQQLRNTIADKVDGLSQVDNTQFTQKKQIIEHNYNRLCYHLDKIAAK